MLKGQQIVYHIISLLNNSAYILIGLKMPRLPSTVSITFMCITLMQASEITMTSALYCHITEAWYIAGIECKWTKIFLLAIIIMALL